MNTQVLRWRINNPVVNVNYDIPGEAIALCLPPVFHSQNDALPVTYVSCLGEVVFLDETVCSVGSFFRCQPFGRGREIRQNEPGFESCRRRQIRVWSKNKTQARHLLTLR